MYDDITTKKTNNFFGNAKAKPHAFIKFRIGVAFLKGFKNQLNILFFNNEEAEGCEEGFKTKEIWFYRLDMPEDYKHFSKTKPMKVEHTLPIQEWWKDRKEIISDEVGEKSRVFTAQQLIDLDCNFDQCKFPKEEEEILPPAELLKQYFEKRAALDHEIDKTLSEIQKILGIDIKSCN